jgi:hypothetical protein
MAPAKDTFLLCSCKKLALCGKQRENKHRKIIVNSTFLDILNNAGKKSLAISAN